MRHTLAIAVAAACALHAFAPAALAADDSWPAKAVRIVVPYATGGGSDILARQIGAGLQPLWKQGIVVDNKAGASGNIGTQEVVRAPADGYTLLLQNSTMVVNQAVMGKLGYDPAKDLTPIMLLGLTPMALAAHPGANIGDLKALVATASANPAGLSYGSCGIGTPQHFVMELLKQKTGVAAAHAGYKGCAPAVTDVVGGQIPLAILSANLVVPYVKSGQLRVVGVSTARRYALLPDAPTFEEQGVKPFDFSIWYALMGPARMPPAVVAKVRADVEKILADPATQARLSTAGVEPLRGDADQLARLIASDQARYQQLARAVGIKAE
jgi:tripartite-type tricarboxylate transporter receptor subunit TctC